MPRTPRVKCDGYKKLSKTCGGNVNGKKRRVSTHLMRTKLEAYVTRHKVRFPDTPVFCERCWAVVYHDRRKLDPPNQNQSEDLQRQRDEDGVTWIRIKPVQDNSQRDMWFNKVYDYAKKHGLQAGGTATVFELLQDDGFKNIDYYVLSLILAHMSASTMCRVSGDRVTFF